MAIPRPEIDGRRTPFNIGWRSSASTICGLTALLVAACGVSHDRVSAAPGKKSPRPAAVGKQAGNPNNLAVTGQNTYIVWPDIKRPGKYVAKLRAKSFRASSPQQTIYVTLIGVSGILFQNGIESATFKAPQVQGDNTHQTIIATGGVVFTSLRSKGTSIKADRVTWSAKTSKGVATGNVIMHYGQSGMTVHTPRLYFDTSMRTVQSSAGYGTLP